MDALKKLNATDSQRPYYLVVNDKGFGLIRNDGNTIRDESSVAAEVPSPGLFVDAINSLMPEEPDERKQDTFRVFSVRNSRNAADATQRGICYSFSDHFDVYWDDGYSHTGIVELSEFGIFKDEREPNEPLPSIVVDAEMQELSTLIGEMCDVMERVKGKLEGKSDG